MYIGHLKLEILCSKDVTLDSITVIVLACKKALTLEANIYNILAQVLLYLLLYLYFPVVSNETCKSQLTSGCSLSCTWYIPERRCPLSPSPCAFCRCPDSLLAAQELRNPVFLSTPLFYPSANRIRNPAFKKGCKDVNLLK